MDAPLAKTKPFVCPTEMVFRPADDLNDLFVFRRMPFCDGPVALAKETVFGRLDQKLVYVMLAS
ncbi:MAG: hypothetical protein KAH44_05160, partial [Oricola sp.]|nr:hypothetical protein [Oricola sp.]